MQAPPNPVYEYVNANYGAGAVAHGHSSLMDVMPDLGVVGMGAFAFAYAGVALLATRRWWRTPAGTAQEDPGAALALLLLLGLVAYGATEPLATTPLGWFLLVVLGGVAGRPTRPSTPRPAKASVASRSDDDTHEAPGLAGRRRHVRR